MKIFTTSLAAILLIVGASADDAYQRIRTRHHSGEGHKPGGKLSPDKLQSMLETECPAIECNGNDADTLTCTFDKPERPDLSGLDEDEIADLKDEFKSKKKEFREKMIRCACCSEMSAEDILAAMGKAGGSNPFEGGGGSGRPQTDGGSSRPGGGFGGRPGGKLSPEKLQNMVDTECLGFDCEGNTAETLTCTFDKPERPDLAGLGEDEIAELKADFKAKKKECKQKMIQCACCADMSVDDILAAMGNVGGASSSGGGFEKFTMGNAFSSTSGDGDGSSNSLSESTSGDQSEPIQGSDKEGGPMPEVDNGSVTSDSSGDGDGSSNSLSGDGSSNSLSDSSSDASSGGKPSFGGDRPQGGGGGGGMDIQAMLAEKCQEIDDDKCASMASQNIDCDRFDSMMTANTRGKFKKILYCGCCRD
jgi:cytochrome c556